MSSSGTSLDPAANLPPRSESDSMGSLPIAAGTLWGCQTQRSLGNFKIGGVESKSKFGDFLSFVFFYGACFLLQFLFQDINMLCPKDNIKV